MRTPGIEPSGRSLCALSANVPDEVLRLTVLLLLFYGGSSWHLSIPLKVACGAALFSQRIRGSLVWWIGITCLVALMNGISWHSIDNHKYLITYWSMTVTLAVACPTSAERVLLWNARGLVGICFGLAVIWKLLAGEYLDGTFWEYTLLTDSRLRVVSSVVGGIPLADLSTNRSLVADAFQWPAENPIVHLATSPQLAGVAKAMSWWGLGIESLIAVLWLCPVRTPLSLKDASLIGFLVTTYMLLPVVGFASVLGVMGFSVAFLENRRRLAFVYLIVLCFVQLASIPWGSYATMHLAH